MDGRLGMLSNLRARLWRRAPDTPIGGFGPRGYVGGLWRRMGQLQRRFLIEQGLAPHHTLLDIACGSLRLGCRIVPYLDPGCYLGIDINGELIEHGKRVELGRRLLAAKRPEFVVSGGFEFERFSRRPDFAIAQSLFSHLSSADIALCLANLARVRKPQTVLYATFLEVDAPVANPAQSHPHRAFRYTRDEMAGLGAAAGWQCDYLGDWGHPRGQQMLRYTT